MQYSFCESIHATGTSPWHIRERSDDQPLMLGGGIQTPSLCGLVERGWDVQIPVSEEQLKRAKNCCLVCVTSYKEKTNGS